MPVLERSELEASPLADLHAIADQLGLEGFRRLRKADLIDAILGGDTGDAAPAAPAAADEQPGPGDSGGEEESAGRRSRLRRRRPRRRSAGDGEEAAESPEGASSGDREDGGGRHDEDPDEGAPDRDEPGPEDAGDPGEAGELDRPPRGAGEKQGARRDRAERQASGGGTIAKGVVEVLGNGSAFLRVDPPEASDADVYISAAQVRRCELVSGDEVTGPVRTPRRSERYPSLVRVETINGVPADAVSDGARYEDLPVAWPSERIALGAGDRTLEAIEWLTPIGLGSRALIVGPPRSGKTETLRRLLAVLHGREGLELSLVLAGSRPEEIAEWAEGPLAPTAALSFAASADAQGQLVERAIDSAKRLAARGSNAVVLIDGLAGVGVAAARKALAAARNLREGGSLTVIATANEPVGGETTVIALDPALASTGREPILDLLAGGTLRAELLVGEDGAQAIASARAAALEASG